MEKEERPFWSLLFFKMRLFFLNKHRVAKTIKPILLPHSFLIGPHGIFISGKGADQHNQCAFWQMKVGNQSIQYPNRPPGINKNIGVTFIRPDFAVFGGYGFQRSVLVVPTAMIRPPASLV